jgi:zinc protease
VSARPSWPGPHDTTRTVLDNGMTVLVRANRAAPVVVLEGMLRAGAVDDPPGRTGLSSFTANMLTRGSARYDYARFNEAIESVGASLSITSDSDGASVGITCLSEDFPTLVDILADALRRPAFPQEQFDLVRRQKLVRLQERDQETAAVANLRFYETVYAGHPLGKPVSGYIESVSAITCDEVAAFHARHYGPQGGIFAVSGDVDPQAAVDLLATCLGDWTAGVPDRVLPPPPPLRERVRLDVAMADKVQSDLVLGVQSVPRVHPDFYAVRLANTVLGVFGMMGRLGEVVRERQGLAYYVYSTQDAGLDTGVWMAGAGVNPAQMGRALDSILAEIERLSREPVTAEELADSKAYLTGVVPLTLETNDGIASTLLNMEWYGLGLDFLDRYSGLIDAVTVEDVQRVAQAYLRPDAIAIVTAGPTPA